MPDTHAAVLPAVSDNAPVAQRSERAAHNGQAAGSIPAGRTNSAMDRAEALAAAAGRADWLASTTTFNPPLCNLRYRLLLYAACTRDARLSGFLPEYRHKARNAIACYRRLEWRE